MSASPSRIAAFDILLQVEQRDAFASELLHSARFEELSTPDHGLATELVMGVLRWRSLLDREIEQHSSQPLRKLDLPVMIALRLAAYQILFLTRVPARAAVHESVELVKRAKKKSAVPFANAVLRKISARPKFDPLGLITDTKTITGLVAAASHPQWLVERWADRHGENVARQICLYDQSPPGLAVRISDRRVETELQREGVALSPGRLLRSARRIASGDVTHTAAFREGRVFVQDEASQLVAVFVGKGEKILDCCAAPGGKTRVLAELSPCAKILAAELHPHRARLLRQLVSAQNVEVVNVDVRHLQGARSFDRVLADVPCSGTGTLARNPEIKWRLKPEDLLDLRSRQLAILQSALQHVAPRGRLVYSTCSLEIEENEAVIDAALKENSTFRIIPAIRVLAGLQEQGELAWSDPGDLTSGPYLRTLPGAHPCDGFFAAILENVCE